MSEIALVCGFADPKTDIAGLAWSLGGTEGGLLLADREVHPAAARMDRETTDTGMRSGPMVLHLEAPIATCEARLAPLTKGGPSSFTPTPAPVTYELSKGGAARSRDCDGYLTRWPTDPRDGATVVRLLALPAVDGGMLLVVAIRPEGGGHDSERTSAWLFMDSVIPVPFDEVLLSSEYDDTGRPTRAGLELWPFESDAPPARAAGTRLGGTEDGEVAAALLATSVEGTHGLGSYVLWRRQGG